MRNFKNGNTRGSTKITWHMQAYNGIQQKAWRADKEEMATFCIKQTTKGIRLKEIKLKP